ncbi:DNA ligase [Limnohabitans sp. T6-5]|uniref:DNA ligase n=1 Tax=Limnohabitans sp. T6-5 TaxID=1100724 RepID=UPI000DD1F1D1|nr:DNA ligase [Limnohabitans sp. T6-5]PUE09603.1 DNA ligase [Limnohabitans sp. T6-5]
MSMSMSVQGAAPLVSRRQVLLWSASPWLATAGSAAAADGERVQLAAVWPQGRTPRGYLVSEKFDGVRAVWDGQVLRFRSGRLIAAPSWFLAALPPLPLDGELWMGRGQFDRVSGAVRKAVPDEDEWRRIQYWVFDAPGWNEPFARRVGLMAQALDAAHVPWLKPVAQTTVPDATTLAMRLREVVQQGGEGLVLHRADALWRAGRSEGPRAALFKFKPEPDEEGQVLGYQPGKGRLHGQTGALLVQMPSGQRFALGAGLSDALRREPPPVGAWVTYRYRDRTPTGLPRFASFVRVRDPE